MPRKVVCARCGALFECAGTIDCWCAAVQVESKRSAEMRAQSRDCLCRDCLAR